jgi:hypothetical protein
MSPHHFVHHHAAHIDIDEELQGEVRRLIERVDRQVELWAKSHPSSTLTPERSPLILEDIDEGKGPQT